MLNASSKQFMLNCPHAAADVKQGKPIDAFLLDGFGQHTGGLGWALGPIAGQLFSHMFLAKQFLDPLALAAVHGLPRNSKQPK
jgi:hypothetical protein